MRDAGRNDGSLSQNGGDSSELELEQNIMLRDFGGFLLFFLF